MVPLKAMFPFVIINATNPHTKCIQNPLTETLKALEAGFL